MSILLTLILVQEFAAAAQTPRELEQQMIGIRQALNEHDQHLVGAAKDSEMFSEAAVRTVTGKIDGLGPTLEKIAFQLQLLNGNFAEAKESLAAGKSNELNSTLQTIFYGLGTFYGAVYGLGKVPAIRRRLNGRKGSED